MNEDRQNFYLFCEVKGAFAAEFLEKIIYSLLTPSVGAWLYSGAPSVVSD